MKKIILLILGFLLIGKLFSGSKNPFPTAISQPGDNPPGCEIYELGTTKGCTPDTINYDFPCGDSDNSTWQYFIATGSGKLTIVGHDCIIRKGIQAAVYDFDLNLVSSCILYDSSSMYPYINLDHLTRGEFYLLMISGQEGDECDFILNYPYDRDLYRISPVDTIIKTPDIEQPCFGTEICFSLNSIIPLVSYEWDIPSGTEIISGGTLLDSFVCLKYVDAWGDNYLDVEVLDECGEDYRRSNRTEDVEPWFFRTEFDDIDVCHDTFPFLYGSVLIESFGWHHDTIYDDPEFPCGKIKELGVWSRPDPETIDTIICPGSCVTFGDSCFFEGIQENYGFECTTIKELRLSFAETGNFEINCHLDTFIQALGFVWSVHGADSFDVFRNDTFLQRQSRSSLLFPLQSISGSFMKIRVEPMNHLGCDFQASEIICPVKPIFTEPEKQVKIVPNPSVDYFFIVAEVPIQKIETFDASGKKIQEDFQKMIDLSEKPKGVYFLKIHTEEEVLIEKVLKI